MLIKDEKIVVIRYKNESGSISRLELAKPLADFLAEKNISRPKWVQKEHDAYLEKFRLKHSNQKNAHCPRNEIHAHIKAILIGLILDEDHE